MQHLLADLGAHYARLPNQPNLHETWAFHERLILPPSQRGRDNVIREFTVIHPNPDLEVEGPGCGGYLANEDLGAWQSHMAWEYDTDWVAGFLAGKRRYVEDPAPAPVRLWPIAHLRHHGSDESGGEEDGRRRTTGAAGTQGVTAPPGPVIAPPTIAPLPLQRWCPQFRREQPQRRPQSPPPLWPPYRRRQHLLRCQRPSPQPGGQHHNNHRGTVAPGTAPHHRGAPSKAGSDRGSRYAAGTATRG
jgi:hypothetical protein